VITAPCWADGPLLAFDLETTGVDVETDRIVTATVIAIEPGQRPQIRSWLADPGVEIPDEASQVHGITTAHARAHGSPAAEVVEQVHTALAARWGEAVPAICFNGTYDLSLLDRELHRHHGGQLQVRGPVVDPLVIDRQVDRYRPGKRQLAVMCEHYGLTLDEAHTSHADALAAARLAWKLAKRYPEEVGTVPLGQLHQQQAGWYRDWALDFANYLQRRGNAERAAEVRSGAEGWPLRARTPVTA